MISYIGFINRYIIGVSLKYKGYKDIFSLHISIDVF